MNRNVIRIGIPLYIVLIVILLLISSEVRSEFDIQIKGNPFEVGICIENIYCAHVKGYPPGC